MQYFNFNGKIYLAGTPVIAPNSRGLRYGDGLFETMKCHEGNLLFANEHFARLWKGLSILQFQVPKHFTPEKLQEEIMSLCKKNGHLASARIRLTVCRGEGGLYDAVNHTPNYIIETWPLPEGNGQWNSNGLVLGIYEAVKKSNDILSSLKHNNYLPCVLAALQAKKEKWNDAILLNNDGRICDTTIANIFLIKDEVVYTPAVTEGCVAGILRKQVLVELAKLNYIVIEKAISVEELMQADEVFLTNSVYNIRWVQHIGDTNYGNSMTQQIYAAILPTIS